MAKQYIVKYPEGSTFLDGAMVQNQQIAKDLVESLRSGCDATIPDRWNVVVVDEKDEIEPEPVSENQSDG